jgi:hypothetical protein
MRLSRRVLVWLLWAGVLAPFLVAGADVDATLLRPSVNLWTQSISLLSEGSTGGLQRAALALAGGFVLVFAAALRATRPPRTALAYAQAVAGIGLLAAGLLIQQGLAPRRGFRLASPWGYLTLVGLLHVVASGVLYAAFAASCAVAAREEPPGAARVYSAATGVAMVLLVPAFVIAAGDGGPAGLLERAAALAALVWEVWLAVRTARAEPAPPPATSSR